jgi:hypothetical protein
LPFFLDQSFATAPLSLPMPPQWLTHIKALQRIAVTNSVLLMRLDQLDQQFGNSASTVTASPASPATPATPAATSTPAEAATATAAPASAAADASSSASASVSTATVTGRVECDWSLSHIFPIFSVKPISKSQ